MTTITLDPDHKVSDGSPATAESINQLTDEMIGRAQALVPLIREQAREAEQLRRLTDGALYAAEQAGLLKVLVPKAWGGMGLGLRALCEISRVLAHGDASAAWTIAFLMEHNWMACRLDMDGQHRLFADRPYIKAAAPLAPDGKAVRVEGGFRVTGQWRYASAMGNSDWVFVTVPLDGADEPTFYHVMIPATDVTVHDAWFMSGMAATSSTTVSVDDVFVPTEMAIEQEIFRSTSDHPGAAHEESFYRYPLEPNLFAMFASIVVGAAEAVVEMGRDRLSASAPFGIARITRESGRMRWGVAHQKVRSARLIYDDILSITIRKGEAQEPWTLEEEGQLAMDIVAVSVLCKEAARIVLDGAGSSAFDLAHPLQRYLRDIQVIANHISLDEDVVHERGSRWTLGLGRGAGDPFPPKSRA